MEKVNKITLGIVFILATAIFILASINPMENREGETTPYLCSEFHYELMEQNPEKAEEFLIKKDLFKYPECKDNINHREKLNNIVDSS